MKNFTVFQKREISLRYWLLGKGFFQTLEAMEFAKAFHTGFRKDGVTPEFDHQVSIAHFVRTLLPSLLLPEATLTTVMLHDVREDYEVDDPIIRQRFGDVVANAVECLTKEFKGVRKSEHEVVAKQALDPIASIVKGADRVHNKTTMVGVFTHKKQVAYLEETEAFILPMLKQARRAFPAQEAAYENIKLSLVTQNKLVRAIHAAYQSEVA